MSLFSGAKREAQDTVTIQTGRRPVNISAPRIPGGVTVITATFWLDGRLDSSVSAFALPVGRSWHTEAPPVSVTQMARALAIAAPLFRAGARFEDVPDPIINEMAYAKWTDPMLGALAFHVRDRRDASPRRQLAPRSPKCEIIRGNLVKYFSSLLDSRIIGALDADNDSRRRSLRELLDDRTLGQPMLTASLAYLAKAATAEGREDHWASERFDRIPPGEVFNVISLPM